MGGFQISDEVLSAVVPNIVYWVYSWMYLALGTCPDYRLHPKEDQDTKNLVSKKAVIKNVLWQQLRQVIAFLLMYKVAGSNGEGASSVANMSSFLVACRQFFVAMVALDTYQYFLHRLMHQNKFLYRHLHSQHHRLVIPYTYGAIYNHPIEGFLFDIVGGVLSYVVSGMSPRMSIYFYCFATIKNVDDHCGLLLPGNPWQFLSNSTAFHDFHHQHVGGKYNFSQPFFAFWDKLLGTYMPLSVVERADGGFQFKPRPPK